MYGGDSYADALFPGLALISDKYAVSVRQVTHSGCAPLSGIAMKNGCTEFNEAVLHLWDKHPKPRLAILVGQWSDYSDELLQGLTTTLDALASAGIAALVIGEPAKFPFDPNRCFMHKTLFHLSGVEKCLR